MPETQSPQIFLGRQPILGREQHLFAYKLLFRDGLASGKGAGLPDPTQATATVIANAFTELATHDALGPYRGFIKVDHELLFSDLIEVLPPQRDGDRLRELVAQFKPLGKQLLAEKVETVEQFALCQSLGFDLF